MRSRPRRARRSTRARAGAGLLAALVVLAPGLVPPATASGQAPTLRAAVVDPALRAEVADAAPGEELDYLLSLRAAPDLAVIENDHDAVVAALKEVAATSQPAVIDEIEDRGAEVLNTFWIGNLILIRSTADVLAALSNEPTVARVLAVQEMTVPEPEPEPDLAPADAEDVTWGLGHIGADDVWDEFGVTGSGVRVAVLDTGVNARHPDLSTRLATDVPGDPYFPGGWMEWDANGVPRHTLPADTNGHGTHVSGTVLGGDASGTHIGVAQGARLMSGRVLPSGSGTTPQIIAGMQWAVDPYDHAGNPAGEPARVVNMSFSPSTGGVIDAMVQPLRNMVAAGVLPVAAAGNCGEGCHGGPGDIPEALTVGATDVADDVAAFSSGATVTTAEFQQPPADWPQSWVVPDVSAPGVDVYSSSSNAFGGIVYARNNGTSMAAPHVAGVAALMLSADPTLTVGQITDALRDTSSFDDRYGLARPNTRYGQGRVDARRAVAHVALHTGVAGTVVDAASLAPVPDVVVSVPGLGISQRTTTDGRFDLRLPPGTYSLEAAWEGRLVATVDALTVTDTVRSADIALSGVAGRVIDAVTGKPASHTAVTAQGTAGDTGVSTTTAGDGSYRLYLSPGTYTLTASRFGYADLAGAGASVTDGQVTSRDLALSPLPTSTITGVVSYGASGNGVPGVTVELADGPRSAVTDSDGRYTIKDVPRGTHRVVAKPELFVEPAPVAVTTTAGSASTVDFTLACGGECSGLWVAREHGPVAAGQDSASATVVSPDGRRLYVAGTSSGEGSQVDYLTVAYDTATGRTLWQARYDGPARGQDGVNDIALSPDGARVYVTGLSVGQGVGPSGGDYATLAYDSTTGDELWLARYNGPGDDFDNARAVEVSPDGGTVLVTGQVQLRTGATSHTDYGTVAYDAATGLQRWVALYDGPAVGFDSANDLAVSPRGDAVFVTGHSPGAGSGWDHATVAYAVRTGEQLWAARYDGPAGGSDDAGALAVSPDGDRLFVTGTTAGDRGLPDYATVAYDTSDGARLWTAAYNGPGGSLDRATALAVSPDGSGVYVTGQSSAGSTGATADYATVRYAAATGATSWVARYSGDAEGADAAAAVAVSRDGSQVVVTGTSAGDGSGDDFATVAYEPADGTQRWAARYDGPAGDDDDAAAVTVSPDGERVFVTGGSDLGIGDDPLVAPSDFATLAYDAAGNASTPVFVSHDVRAVPPVVAAGDPLHTVAEVTNVGVGTGSYAATLVLDGVAAVTTDVALGPGESTTVVWDLPEIAAGTHELRVGAASSELLAVACDRRLTGQHRGHLTVSSGTTCLDDGARVTGGVTVEAGAGLLATRASITGPVTAAGAALLALTDASVSGPVTATGVTQALSIVSSRTGPLTVEDNAPLLPAAVSGNDVHGPLTCTDNTPAPIDLGDPNEAGGRTGGQCSAR